jgi:hypothetical protein
MQTTSNSKSMLGSTKKRKPLVIQTLPKTKNKSTYTGKSRPNTKK